MVDPARAGDQRSALLKDGVDRTVSYDVAEVRANLDRAAARLEVTVRLHKPFPADVPDYYWAGVSIAVGHRPTLAADCRYAGGGVGHTSILIEPRAARPTALLPEIHVAEVRVSYRGAPVDLPLTFSDDRKTATVMIEDNLLRRADLRCLNARATGRGPRDASQPDGGPSADDIQAAYFKGFSPQARRRQMLRRCEQRHRGRQNAGKRSRCKRVARTRTIEA